MLKRKILVIEDDKSLAVSLQVLLSNEGYDVYIGFDGQYGLEQASQKSYSLIITDINLPKMSGLEIVSKVRAKDIKTPIIVITNVTTEQNEIMAYKIKADLFHKKPLNYELLIKQVQMLLSKNIFSNEEIIVGDIVISPKMRIFKKSGKEINLSKKEFDFMVLMTSYPGEVFTRSEILNQIGFRSLGVDDRSVDKLVSRIRQQIGSYEGEDVIETVYNKGFRLNQKYLDNEGTKV